MRRELVLGGWRDLSTVGLVGSLCGAYAGVLVTASSLLRATAAEGGAAVGVLLAVVATVFILIAVYVSAVVMVNAVDTVVAGRLRQVALLRLLGARGPELRASVMRASGLVGGVGAVVGAVAGVLATDVFRVVLVARGTLPDVDYPVTSPYLLAPVAVVGVTTLFAGWVGARGVLRVSPVQAMSSVDAGVPPTTVTARWRAVLSSLLIGGGGLVLVLAAALAEAGSVAGFLLAFVGSASAATGLLVGARLVIPRLVLAVSVVLGSSPASRIARRNAVADRMRTTRSTMGLVIGVTLVTTFASGMDALQTSVHAWNDLSIAQRQQTETLLSTATVVLLGIVIVSSVISAVGFVSTMSLTVIHRRREIGLLRALGFTATQVRAMVARESAVLAGTAALSGLVLGVVFGSVGAQSLVGRLTDGFVWGLPWPVLGAVAASALVLVFLAALPPARRAVAVAPVEALRVDR
ncbi:ABC transporter permease [Ornithinibacter aureus]|uniref:ABC transporter permease n=1 Tax=Ornithinibacter aureus TaxID=622664 RepID=UPI0013588E5F|nr:ABC transporter permease [Ornithinibacter aureus]KAF0833254.1 putative ABC transport system permease protein [Ornithinibacter aureus]